jgi:hypothetical protein
MNFLLCFATAINTGTYTAMGSSIPAYISDDPTRQLYIAWKVIAALSSANVPV